MWENFRNALNETRAVDISWLEGEGNIAEQARPKKRELGASASAPDSLNPYYNNNNNNFIKPNNNR